MLVPIPYLYTRSCPCLPVTNDPIDNISIINRVIYLLLNDLISNNIKITEDNILVHTSKFAKKRCSLKSLLFL